MNIKLDKSLLYKLMLSSMIWSLFIFFRTFESKNTSEEVLLFTFGILPVDEIKWVIPIWIWLIPLLLLNFFLGDHISKQLNEHAPYIFTRTSKRGTWFINQSIIIAVYILFFHIVLLMTILILCLIFRINIFHSIDTFTIMMHELVLLTLSQIVSIWMINTLGLIFKAVLSSAAIIATNMICLLLGGLLLADSVEYYSIVKWIPFTQSVLGWQISMFTGIEPLNFDSNYDFAFAVFHLLVTATFTVLAGKWMIKRMDLY